MNPIAYLLISLEFTSLMLAVVFLIAWFNFGRKPHALIWSLTFAVAAVQWLLNLNSKALFQNQNLYWLIVSATSIITLSLALAGHRKRAGRPNPIAWYVVAGITVEAAIAYVTLVQPHVGLRMSIGPFYAALMLGLSVPSILGRARTLPTEWGLATVITAFAVCEAAAGIAVLCGGAAGDPAMHAIYLQINFLSLPATYIGSGMFTVLMLASDMAEQTRQLALVDQLTGVLNRRGFDEAANRTLATARRQGDTLSAVFGDLDHFKAINDRYGHAIGDEALRQFAHCMRNAARANDVIGRMGGEEFVMLLPGTPEPQACAIAERLRLAAAALSIDAGEKSAVNVRASFGVAAFTANDADIEGLLRRADSALYQAKQGGRNRVMGAAVAA